MTIVSYSDNKSGSDLARSILLASQKVLSLKSPPVVHAFPRVFHWSFGIQCFVSLRQLVRWHNIKVGCSFAFSGIVLFVVANNPTRTEAWISPFFTKQSCFYSFPNPHAVVLEFRSSSFSERYINKWTLQLIASIECITACIRNTQNQQLLTRRLLV